MTVTLGFAAAGFRRRSPIRDFWHRLRRWLTYRPERRYLGGRKPGG